MKLAVICEEANMRRLRYMGNTSGIINSEKELINKEEITDEKL
jgi:hypothetical protein